MSERSIFLSALDITDPNARREYLDQACGDDARLRGEVETLLASHGQAEGFLETPAAEQVAASNLPTQVLSDSAMDPHHPAAADEIAPASLGFLQPSHKSGSLGRLGHYDVLEVLGQGAFGIVMRAFDEKLQRVVAIKVLNPELAATSPPRKRFLREAQSSARVKHENLVAIYGVEEQPIPYLVMEYVPGQTLQQRLDQKGPLDVADILRIGQQIAAGLAAAHAQGLIHRDIKPSNILLEAGVEERAKITDFGLARAVDDASLTQSGLIAGTPMYMAPEQARGESLDHRTDLFSLGSVLYTMASGRPPFRAPNTIAVLKRVCDDTPRPITEVIPETPPWLCDIIAKLHAKDPADRFQTAKEVADVLGQHLAHLREPNTAPRPAPIVAPVQQPAETPAHSGQPALADLKWPARGLLATAGLHALTLVAFLLMLLFGAASQVRLPIGGNALVLMLSLGSLLSYLAGQRIPQGQSYGLGVLGSLAAMFTPGPGQFLGLPMGIWSLVVLNRPKVRAVFRQQSLVSSQGVTLPATSRRWVTAAVLAVLAVIYLSWSGTSLVLMANNQAMIRTVFGSHPIRLALHRDGKTTRTNLDTDLRLAPGKYTLEIETPIGLQVASSTCYHQTLFGFQTRSHMGGAPQELVIGRGDFLKITAKLSPTDTTAPAPIDLTPLVQAVELARLLANETRERHTEGTVSLVEVVEAEVRLAEAEFNLAGAQQDWYRQDELLGTLAGHHRQLRDIARERHAAGQISQTDVMAAEVAVQTVEARQQRLRTTHGDALIPRSGLRRVDLASQANFINPRQDCSMSLTTTPSKSTAKITVPGTTLHDLNPTAKWNNLDAPRALVNVAGDFIVQVRVLPFAPSQPRTSLRQAASYRAAGLVVWNNDQTFLRHERASTGEIKEAKPHLQSEWFAEKEQLDLRYVPTIEGPIYLQIERHGHLLWLRWSDDGREWHESAEVGDLDLADKLQVGLVAINATSQPLEAVFEDFQLQSAAMSPTSPDGTITLPFPGRTKNWWDWATSAQATWQPLFNGRDLEGWQPNDHWQIEDGCLVTRVPADATKTPPMLVTSRTDYLDFHVRMEAKLNEGGDSGFFFRFGEQGNKALQVQITSAPSSVGGILKDALTVVHSAKQVPPETWFTLEIMARGQQIAVLVDGEPVINWTDPTRDLAAGPFAFESGFPGTEFRIRKIEVKLPVASPTTSAESAPPLAIAPFDAAAAKAHQEAWAKHLGVPVEYTNPLGMKFRLIPPGEFLMGSTPEEIEAALTVSGGDEGWPEWINSEPPPHKVILTQPVYFGVTEVTQAQYEQVMGKNPSDFAATGARKQEVANLETGNHPVETVSWNEAAEFCAKLSRQEQLKPFYLRTDEVVRSLVGTGYRLPTEAEWEFACRAGTTTRYWSGDEPSNLASVGWYGDISGRRTHAVGELKANPFGLYDMHGNVWECVQDSWDPASAEKIKEGTSVDPFTPFSAHVQRVFRGGNWDDHLTNCRSSTRLAHLPTFRHYGIGVRVVLQVEAVRQAIPTSAANLDAPKPAVAPFDATQANAHQDAWAKHLGVPVEYTNSIGMKFRLIPPGEFTMGTSTEELAELLKQVKVPHEQGWFESEGPARRTVIESPFYLGAHEVTIGQFQSFIAETKYQTQDERNGTGGTALGPDGMTRKPEYTWRRHAQRYSPDHPVAQVTLRDAQEYCAWLSRKEGRQYVVPSEDRWEFACRAGTTTPWNTGREEAQLTNGAWYGGNSDGVLQPVGKKPPNPFGLHDMHGGIQELCVSAAGWPYGRAGSLRTPAIHCRSAARNRHTGLDDSFFELGFRVAIVGDLKSKSLASAISPFDATQAKAHQEAWAKYLGVPVEYTNSLGMKFRLIPPGEFLMGSTPDEVQTSIKIIQQVVPQDVEWQRYVQSESTQHKVLLSQPFYLGSHEVTQRDYETVMGTNPSRFAKTGKVPEFVEKVAGLDTSHFAVECVSWNDAAEFCAKLSQRERLKPVYFRADIAVTPLEGNGYRLPSEAQWEFACRAGTTTRFSSGNGGDRDLLPSGWFWTNAGQRIHAVGELKANPFGLFDMHGNAAEWVQDAWEPGYYEQFATEPTIDPTGAAPGGGERINRVIRGGYWLNGALACRSGSRFSNNQLGWSEQIGFRVVLPVDAVKAALAVGASQEPSQGIVFRGNDQHVDVPHLTIDGLDTFTVETRFRWDGHQSKQTVVAALGNPLFALDINPDGSLVVYLLREKSQQFTSGVKVQPRVWHDVAVTVSGRAVTLFLDGKKQATQTTRPESIGATETPRDRFFIGAGVAWDVDLPIYPFHGAISALRVSNAVRYQADYTPVARRPVDPATLALFHFDEGQGAVLHDDSTHGRHGKIRGATWMSTTEIPTAAAIAPSNADPETSLDLPVDDAPPSALQPVNVVP